MAYLITIIVTVIGTGVGLLAISLLAYGPGCRRDIPGVRVVFILILITMLFNGGLVPQYLIYSNTLHVKNTLFALILPNLLMSGFTVILVKNYFQSNIPGEMLEAAEIDGAGQFQHLLSAGFPAFDPDPRDGRPDVGGLLLERLAERLYYITDHNLYSLQQLLNEMNNNIQYLGHNASNLAGLTPRPFQRHHPAGDCGGRDCADHVHLSLFQKYFAKGITMGSVKG